MTTKQAAELYARAGRMPPPEIATPSAEHIRGTRRKMVDGIEFRSTLEATAYQILKSWRDAGAITALELQPRFVLQAAFRHDGKTVRAMTYRADFRFKRYVSYLAMTKHYVIEVKGFRTEAYGLRRKLFLARYGAQVVFEEWTRETIKGLL